MRPQWHGVADLAAYPKKSWLDEPDALDRWVVDGWQPNVPFITRDTRITALGSCFAAELTKRLHSIGQHVNAGEPAQSVYLARHSAAINHTYCIAEHFRMAFEDAPRAPDLWIDEGGTPVVADRATQDELQSVFRHTDVFVITLGLAEVWCDRMTGDVAWRAIPQRLYDPNRHTFRVLSVEENVENLEVVLGLIETHVPGAAVVFTVSPVPLRATFRNVSCIVSNTVSKSILRVAVDEAVRGRQVEDRIYYWPSYEMVTSFFADPYLPDNRHVKPEVVDEIVRAFCRAYMINP